MIRSSYYHPDRITWEDTPILSNRTIYESIYTFVSFLEKIVPQCVHDLKQITTNSFDEAIKFYSTSKFKGRVEYHPSNWHLVKKSDTLSEFSTYSNLRQELLRWIDRYNLHSTNDYYITLALWSVDSFYNKSLESEEHEENLSMLNNILYEKEYDIYKIDKDLKPFIFMPTYLCHPLNKKRPPIEKFENKEKFYYEEDEEKSDFRGISWDPLSENWSEFEESMIYMFNEYTKLYRERTLERYKSKGYIEAKEKRKVKHFIWLVYYQVLGFTLRDIADIYNSNEDTVWKGIKSTSEIVLINLSNSLRKR
ncbi:hypothetical protein IAQ67_15625 [Paenibacillus peoriae]|uniref:Uncharacterized protein n=1 Tax=Paenibacillus peoriae TaxID=59893 RepID=A0A7H0Y2L8_9BACL|nr:hypothetical protein [Paenibacillus peoriae]QNR65326.1 hypothetical protein IAQ67_15625 [Paenibacillus peoriae]